MVDVLEYYFSDDCLSKNAYLLKQVSAASHSIKSVSSLGHKGDILDSISINVDHQQERPNWPAIPFGITYASQRMSKFSLEILQINFL